MLPPFHDPDPNYHMTRDDYNRVVMLVKALMRTSGGKGMTVNPAAGSLEFHNPEKLALTDLGPTVLGGNTTAVVFTPFRVVEMTGQMGNKVTDWLTPPIMNLEAPASDDPVMWGITADRIQKSIVGDVYTEGILPCWIARDPAVGTTKWARPTTGKTYLTADPSGETWVIAEQQVANPALEHWCLVRLGGPKNPNGQGQWHHFQIRTFPAKAVGYSYSNIILCPPPWDMRVEPFVTGLAHGYPALPELGAGRITKMRAYLTTGTANITQGAWWVSCALAPRAQMLTAASPTYVAQNVSVVLDETHRVATGLAAGDLAITEGDGLTVFGHVGVWGGSTWICVMPCNVDVWVKVTGK